MAKITRRRFLEVAGGVTFLALVPAGRGLFAMPPPPPALASGERGGGAGEVGAGGLPLFVVLPYIQPGPGSDLAAGRDTLVVAWQTENLPARFHVEYGATPGYGQIAAASSSMRSIGRAGKKNKAAATPSAPSAPIAPATTPTPDGSAARRTTDAAFERERLNYHATLTGLPLGATCYYRVVGNGQTVAEGYAATRRAPAAARSFRFVAFGDNSFGDISDRAIAYHAYKAAPAFVLNTGDNVYENGYDDEYARYFFPVYNADEADQHTGAPLLRSVPFYTVLANHDVTGRDDNGGSCGNFDSALDSLAYYTAMHLPMNGLAAPPRPTPLAGAKPGVDAFLAAAGERYPRMANYSFDYGSAHFLCLDSNIYVDPTDPALQAWIDADLTAAKGARWKFVNYHHPAFNVGLEHYREQHMRVLMPLLERHGVDIVFNGHEHTYQRTMPLRFKPTDESRAKAIDEADRRVPGVFTVDTRFDGQTRTRPDGVIHVTTGAGGKELYDVSATDNPPAWLHDDDGNVAYVAKFYSRLHSLTVVDIDGDALTLRQIDEFGGEVDRVRVTKA